MKRYYERSLESKQKIASKFGISNRTLAIWVMDGEWENKVILKEIRAMYETHGMSINALSKKYGVSVSLIRKFKIRDKWEKKKITNEAATVLKDNLTIDKMGLFLDTKKQELKENLKKSLEHLDLDPVVVEAIAETSSDELIFKAMNTAYIKKQILFCAIVARGELIKMIKRAGDKVKDNISIIVAAEKVSKLFIDAGVSLFGKEQIQAVEIKENSDYRQMSIKELMALANTDDNVN
ncbi:terminase [Helicobacter pylori]|uniref:terminase n=1 Tax=Helicobacter pylori TaxID=210 RepID=UPI00165B654E